MSNEPRAPTNRVSQTPMKGVGAHVLELAAKAYRTPWLLLVITTMTWGGNVTLAKAVSDHIPPIMLAQMRWSLAFVLLVPFAVRHLARDWPVLRAHLPVVLFLAAAGIAAYNTLVYIGLQSTTAVSASLLQSIQPVLIAVFALVLYRDRPNIFQAVGILVSTVGFLTILSRGDPNTIFDLAFEQGDLWIVAAMVVYSLYTVVLKSRPEVHPLTLLTVLIGLGQSMLIPFSVAEVAGGASVRFDWVTVATVAYVAVFASVVAYVCYNRGVELLGPNRAAPFLNLVPVWGSLFAVALLGEVVAWYHLVGWLLVVSGIVLAQQHLRSTR